MYFKLKKNKISDTYKKKVLKLQFILHTMFFAIL